MVSVGQPLDVAVTLPQRCGVLVSEPCGSERASPSLLPLGLINFDHSLFCCCSRCASCRAHIRRPPGVLHGHQRRFEGSDGSKKLAYRY